MEEVIGVSISSYRKCAAQGVNGINDGAVADSVNVTKRLTQQGRHVMMLRVGSRYDDAMWLVGVIETALIDSWSQ